MSAELARERFVKTLSGLGFQRDYIEAAREKPERNLDGYLPDEAERLTLVDLNLFSFDAQRRAKGFNKEASARVRTPSSEARMDFFRYLPAATRENILKVLEAKDGGYMSSVEIQGALEEEGRQVNVQWLNNTLHQLREEEEIGWFEVSRGNVYNRVRKA